MTTLQTVTQFAEVSKEAIVQNIYGDAWRMTSYLIQLMNKLEGYYTSLNEDNPEADFFTAQIATASALELINNTYTVPTNDERFESVREIYEATVDLFITDFSDDATADVVHISKLANYVAEMRTYCWSQVLESGCITEESAQALKLAKRDEKAVELAVKMAADVIFAD